MKASILIILLSTIFIIAAGPWHGREAEADSELAKKTQNPVSDLISLPFQNNTDFGVGPDYETQNILNIQPVWPISLNDNWNLVTRTILPVISQPGLLPEQDRTNGLGDTTLPLFYPLRIQES